MLLVIDVGNTNITIGIYNGNRISGIWRVATDAKRTADEYGTKILDILRYSNIDVSVVRAVAVASVVPVLDPVLKEFCKKYLKLKPFFVRAEKQKYVKILYKNPSEVGADRVANAAAAYSLYRSAAIVIDFGTATTFDCINKNGEYMGGVIIPGPKIAAESLALRTAKLPRVDIKKPKRVINKTTAESMQSGIYYGYIGMIKELIKKVKLEMEGKPVLIATGGLSDLILNDIKEVKITVPELTLEGIRIIWESSRNKGCGYC